MLKSTFANTGMIAKSSLLRRIKTTKKEKCIYCNIKYLWILFPLSKYTIVNSDSPSLSSGCFFWPSLHKLGIYNKIYWKQIMFDIFCSFYSLAANTWSWLTHFVNMSPLQTKPNCTIKNFLEEWKKLSKRRGSHWDEFCQFIKALNSKKGKYFYTDCHKNLIPAIILNKIKTNIWREIQITLFHQKIMAVSDKIFSLLRI